MRGLKHSNGLEERCGDRLELKEELEEERGKRGVGLVGTTRDGSVLSDRPNASPLRDVPLREKAHDAEDEEGEEELVSECGESWERVEER